MYIHVYENFGHDSTCTKLLPTYTTSTLAPMPCVRVFALISTCVAFTLSTGLISELVSDRLDSCTCCCMTFPACTFNGSVGKVSVLLVVNLCSSMIYFEYALHNYCTVHSPVVIHASKV